MSKTLNILFCKGFCFHKGDNDRGGFVTLLKAYAKAFTRNDDVVLTCKFNSAYNNGSITLDQALANTGVDLGKCPPCRFVVKNIPFEQLVGIYQLADVSVIPTKGEAFCLTVLESMMCGVPVVTSNFGGQTDFINDKNGWILPTKLGPATDDMLCYEGMQWGYVDVDELAKLLRHIYENRDEIKPKAELALKDSKKFTWEHSAKKAINALKQL